MTFKGIPSFSPEIFREIINKDPMKTKQLEKGIMQLTEEGVAQLFTLSHGSTKIIGTVGDLQFDVIQYRLKNEYGASVDFRSLSFYKACWLTCDDQAVMNEFLRTKSNYLAYDKEKNPVFLASSEWILRLTQQDFPKISFHFSSEFKKDTVII
jgi:peptide chain release factor 3